MLREQRVELLEAVLALVKLILDEVLGAVRRRDHQQPVVREDPPELGNRRDVVVEMFDHFEADEQVEASVLERQPRGVRLLERQAVARARVRHAFFVEVDANRRVRSSRSEERGPVALATADVEHTASRCELGGKPVANEVLGINELVPLELGNDPLAGRLEGHDERRYVRSTIAPSMFPPRLTVRPPPK